MLLEFPESRCALAQTLAMSEQANREHLEGRLSIVDLFLHFSIMFPIACFD